MYKYIEILDEDTKYSNSYREMGSELIDTSAEKMFPKTYIESLETRKF